MRIDSYVSFGGSKDFRRDATRYDKRDDWFLAFVPLAGIASWLNSTSIFQNALGKTPSKIYGNVAYPYGGQDGLQ